MQTVFTYLKRCFSTLTVFCLALLLTPHLSLAQSSQGEPLSKNELAQRIFSNWTELSSETIDGILFSDTNLEVRRYVEAIVLGESPAVLDAHLRNMELDESTQERILTALIQELRKNPSRLSALHRDIQEFNEYKPFMDVKNQLGTGIFNSAILTVDFTAIWFGTAGAVDSLAHDFASQHQQPAIFTAVMMLIGSGLIAETINIRRTAGELVREWKKKRRKNALAKKLQSLLTVNSSVFSDEPLNEYRISDDIERHSSELLPHLIAKMTKDAQSSWRARRKLRSFTRRLQSSFSIAELERMGLYGFKQLSKLEQVRLKVPLMRWFIKEVSEKKLIDVSDRSNYRRAITKLSTMRLELRDTSRKTNFFLLNKFSIGMITIASAIQGLSLAVNSAAPGVINFDNLIGRNLLYLKDYEPIITILTVSAIALSVDFQAIFNSSRKRALARSRNRRMQEQVPIIEGSLREESRSSFINNQTLKPAPTCSSLL